MTRIAQLLPWLAIQTRLVQCFTIALLLHVGGICILGTIKLVARIIPTHIICTFPPPETPVNLPPGDGGESTLVSGSPITPTAPATLPPRLPLHDPIIGIKNPLVRPTGIGELVKLNPISSTLPVGPGSGNFGSHTGSSGNSFYDIRFKPKIGGPVDQPHATKESEGAVLAALRWLRDHQEVDGSWKCPRSSTATSGLALLAFLAHGETADSKDFGDAVSRGLGFLVRSIDAHGTVPGKNKYAQAIVTLALCEGYALTRSPALREPAERAAQVLITAQAVPKSNLQHTGGWRYTPTSADADTSVTGWTIMALQAADHAGIVVPVETFTKASAYLWRMHGKDGFGYAAPGDAPVPTAIATFCLQFLGHAGDSRLRKALDLLKQQPVSWQQSTGAFVLYGWYYSTLALFQGGGADWESWNKKIVPALLAAQANDGSWLPPPHSTGEAAFAGTPTYSTALGAMILETYYRYQPQYLQKKKAG